MLWLALLFPAFAQVASTVSEPLRRWAEEIEKVGGNRVVFVRALYQPQIDAWLIPEDVQEPGIVSRYLSQPGFRAQLAAAHALTLNYQGPEGGFHFIVMNMTRAAEFQGVEEGLLAHELGHAWLAAKGYQALPYLAGARACVATISSDIVQHVLLRSELERRGIDYRGYWLRQMEAERPAAGLAGCARLIQLVHAVDAFAGLDAKAWPGLNDFSQKLEAADPRLASEAAGIAADLLNTGLEDRDAYATRLSEVEPRVAALYDRLHPVSEPDPQPTQNKEQKSPAR